MLKRLIINNYALIDVLDINIPEHLVIITGDSGAGKSILLGALSLLLGGRFDGTVIKDAERNCVVEAQFDDHIVRRVVTPAGRSRVFIDDEPASVEAVRALAASEIDIHSQNSQLLLGDDAFRLSTVDSYAGSEALLKEYRAAYDAHSEISRRLNETRRLREQKEHEREYTRFRYEQLEKAQLKQGELEEIEARQKTLANAELIKQTLLQAEDALSLSEASVEHQLREAERSLEKLAQYFPAADDLSRRISSCRIEIKDISDTIDNSQEKIDASPAALLQVEERIAQLYDLMRRNDVSSEEELIAVMESYRRDLEDTDSLAQQEEELAKEEKRADEICEAACNRLSEARKAAVAPLSDYLQRAIRELDMPQAQFEVECEPLSQRTRDGREKVRFMFSSTASGRMADVARTASGGEISRIMLCIKALLAEHKALPTVIFDEIDTGMSGSLADKVGRKIVDISKNIQVIAITHLPQVAAKGDAHYLVYKEYLPQGALSRIRRIEGEERVAEIARMISGSSITAEAVAAAKVLLDESN